MIEVVEQFENFLTKKDIENLKSTVFFLNSYWKKITNDSENGYVLGESLYTLNTKQINPDINAKMLKEFGDLYDKTLHFFSEKLAVPLHLSSLTTPGFHIFKTPNENPAKTFLEDFHRDITILGFCPTADPQSIISFSILINNTNDPSYLEIQNGDKIFYSHNKVTLWNGLVPHRIGRINWSEEEYRITYQGHIFKDISDNKYYVHF